MKSQGFFSKPLALVIIGIVLGASLGLGSGYAVIYPQMVKEQNKTFEEKLNDVESKIQSVSAELEELNQTFQDVHENFLTVKSLTEAINSLNSKIIAMDNSITGTNIELDGVEDDVSALRARLDAFEEERSEIVDGFDELESQFNAFNSKLQTLENRIDSRESIDRFRRLLANPDESLLDKITEKMYSTLNSNKDFSDWSTSIGTAPAKSLLKQETYKLTGTFVWNSLASNRVGEKEYQVITETYFPFNFSPASISIPKIRMQIRGNVNIATGKITNIQVEAVEIV